MWQEIRQRTRCRVVGLSGGTKLGRVAVALGEERGDARGSIRARGGAERGEFVAQSPVGGALLRPLAVCVASVVLRLRQIRASGEVEVGHTLPLRRVARRLRAQPLHLSAEVAARVGGFDRSDDAEVRGRRRRRPVARRGIHRHRAEARVMRAGALPAAQRVGVESAHGVASHEHVAVRTPRAAETAAITHRAPHHTGIARLHTATRTRR